LGLRFVKTRFRASPPYTGIDITERNSACYYDF
jgi:hypothetical protein